jgi:quinol-cytochrome oxidoreductase complex cytochrome b subunit
MHQVFRRFLNDLKRLPATFVGSVRRHGKVTSDRARSQAVFANLFLHIHSVKTHKNSLKPSYTLGLGLLTTACLLILTATGILLMVYYKPTPEQAYASIKDIHFVVPTGRMIRNLHRWAAHGMVIFVFLHMARVFYTASYRKPREFNWFAGVALLALTLALSFTGYLLPWDQLAYWATTIGANIASSPRELTDALGITHVFDPGGLIKQLLLGANTVGAEALIRFHLLHVMVLPILLFTLLGVHFWRIRKDGGLSRPASADPAQEEEFFPRVPTKTYGLMAIVRGKSPAVGRAPENTVNSWPHLFIAEMAVLMFSTALLLILSMTLDAPLKEPANPAIPENPAKAPWYFLGIQELVSYSGFMGGIGIPLITLIGLMLIPYLDREKGDVGVWFSGPEGRRVALTSLIFSATLVVGLLAFVINFGWLREWYPDISQLAITFVNPGSVITVCFAAWSLWVLRRHQSTRMAAIALFTCFLVGYVILTYVGTVHRGPNWEFYWSQSDWPVH